jgi:hypothetical protein
VRRGASLAAQTGVAVVTRSFRPADLAFVARADHLASTIRHRRVQQPGVASAASNLGIVVFVQPVGIESAPGNGVENSSHLCGAVDLAVVSVKKIPSGNFLRWDAVGTRSNDRL